MIPYVQNHMHTFQTDSKKFIRIISNILFMFDMDFEINMFGLFKLTSVKSFKDKIPIG